MNHTLLEICTNDLFTDRPELEAKYPPATVGSILRVRNMYLYLNDCPTVKDADFVQEDIRRHKVTRPTAYSDMAIVKTLLPMVSKVSRDYNMFVFAESLKEVINHARGKGDYKLMEKALATFARYMRLDQEEPERIPIDKVATQSFVLSDDPSVIGFDPMPDRRQKVQKLLDHYLRETPDLREVDFEPADLEFEELFPAATDIKP